LYGRCGVPAASNQRLNFHTVRWDYLAASRASKRKFNSTQSGENADMAKAVWNGVVLAESDTFEIVEGNIYFPPEAIKSEYFRNSTHHTTCGWKGEASYYTVEVNGQTNQNAAWYYPMPKNAAKNITGYIAFWHGVKVER
jgi:uncharacterized protein (DUF427 family)